MPEQAQRKRNTPDDPASMPADSALAYIVDGLPDGVLLLDKQWRITYANPTARNISRIRPEDLNGKTYWELYPETLGTTLEVTLRAVMATRHERSVEAFFYERFHIWFSLRVLPIPGAGIAFNFRDVTAAHSAEDANRESEERLRIALAAANGVGTWDWDVPNDRVYADAPFATLYGVDPHRAAAGVPIAEFTRNILPEDLQTVGPAIDATLQNAGEFISQYRIRQADGSARWVSARGRCTHDSKSSPLRFTGVIIDITEQKLREEALRDQNTEIDRQRRELETIYRGSPIGMALYEPKELRLIRINDRQAEIFRMLPSEAIGKRYVDLTAGVPQALTLIRRAASGENILNQDLEGTLERHPDDQRYWNVNYSPIFDENGAVRAIAAATIETTQQKRAEAALIQSEKLAAVGRMASSIAHEINNPLESVTNLLYIARSYTIASDAQHFLDLADQELRRVAIIVNQTLRFHKQATLPREITCVELFTTVLSLYEGRLRNSGITLEKRKRAGCPITCFEGDIRQVLNNLVSNAIDAMPTGGRLLLRSREATDWRTGRAGLTLTVADTGSGMSPETRARVFEAFFTTKGINGTGLGLWIGNEIVARHDGRLLLRTSQDPTHRGTVFNLFIPFSSALSSNISTLVQ